MSNNSLDNKGKKISQLQAEMLSGNSSENLNTGKFNDGIFRKIIDNIADVIVIIDKDGLTRYNSPNIERLFGWETSDLIGLNMFDSFHPEDIDSAKQFMSRLQEGYELSGTIELRHKCKDGQYQWIEFKGVNMLHDPDIKGILGNYHNISERKLAEEKISESEKKFRLLFENLIAGFALHEMIYDENGHPFDYRYIEVNPAFERLTGVSAKGIIGKTVKEVMPETEQHWIDTFGRVASTGESVSYQNFAKEIGKYFDVWAFSPSQGRFAVMFMDITERLRHESEIAAFNEELAATNEELTVTSDALKENNLILEEAKVKAEESDRLKTAFLANMSHEIRTPMNGIMGFADLLKTPDLTGEKQLEFIQIIQKSGERMLNIINDLISISKIESGLMEVSFSDTNINDQLDFLYRFFHSEASLKGINLILNCPLHRSQAIIKTDKEKIYAIFTNLLKNAIKFTKAGKIEFGYEIVSDSNETPANYKLKFYVKDTGIGIPPEKHESVFDRFVQAESSVSRGYEGSGLGLSISKAYVELLGGKILLDSEPGKGSYFYFTLPFATGNAFKNTRYDDFNSELINETMNHTILIAEDDEESFLYLSIILEDQGYNILHAVTGEEAVNVCRENQQIHLILMDIKMPKMDGHTAAKIIKSFLPDLPIIAQTAFALETEKEKYRETFDDYITKPIKAGLLKEKISWFLNRGNKEIN